MITFETDVVAVLKSLVQEAIAGNTTAGKIVLEHSGKLAKHFTVNHLSPYDEWLAKKYHHKIENAEIIIDELPEQPKILKVKDNSKWNERRRELHKWKKRAKAVNIKPLPNRRPTKGQRLAWEESIVRAEQEQS